MSPTANEQKTFGQLLREKRTDRKMTLHEFARACGLSERGVSNYERDEAMPLLPAFLALCRFLEWDINEAFDTLGYHVPRVLPRVEGVNIKPCWVKKRGSYFKFGQVLRRERIERGYTQTAIAGSLGIAYNTWAYLEAGRHLPTLTTLGRFRRRTGLDVAWAVMALPDSVARPRAVDTAPDAPPAR